MIGLALLWLMSAMSLRGATRAATWISPTDGDWDNPSNWLGGVVPRNTATDTFIVYWREHPVTVRVRGSVTVDDFFFASGGVLELADQSTHFEVRNQIEWTHGIIEGKSLQGSAGTAARVTAHGYTLIRGPAIDSLALRGMCDFVIKDYCNFESILRCADNVRLKIAPSGSLQVRPGAGFVRTAGQPSFVNEGMISIYSDPQPFLSLPILSTGRVFVGARTVEFLTPFPNEEGIHVNEGLLHLEESIINGHLQLDDGELRGSGQIKSAEVQDPISGHFQFGELTLGDTTSMTFVIGRPHDQIQVAGALTINNARPILQLARGFIPGPDHEFEILTATGGIDGQFEDFDLASIEFGPRRDVIGFVGSGPATAVVGSFLMELTSDSRVVVLRNFLPPPVKLDDTRLVYQFPQPEAGEVGGCFAVPHAAINLPAGNWANGKVEVAITQGYTAGIDALSFRRNADFPDSASLRFTDLSAGSQTVSFRGTAFGTVRIDGPRMTCAFNDQASADAVVALLGWLHYGNTEFTPDWFKQASDRYPSRTILTTLTDSAGNQKQVPREVTFPHLVGISLGDDQTLTQDDYYEDGAMGRTTLVVQGRFSTLPFDRTLPVPNLSTVWRSNCKPLLLDPSVGIPGRRRVEMYTEFNNRRCCVVETRAGSLASTVNLSMYVGSSAEPDLSLAACFILRAYGTAVCDVLPPPLATPMRHRAAPVPPLSLAPFYTLQSLMKQSPGGSRLVDLYWQHTAEVVRIVFSNPMLRSQARTVLTAFQPGVTALISGRGTDFRITQPMIDQLNDLWTSLADLSSPALKTVLLREHENYGRFQAFVDHDFTRWANLLALPVPTEPYIHVSRTVRTATVLSGECNDVPGAGLSLWRSTDLRRWDRVENAVIERDGHRFGFADPTPPAQASFYQIRRVEELPQYRP